MIYVDNSRDCYSLRYYFNIVVCSTLYFNVTIVDKKAEIYKKKTFIFLNPINLAT